MRRNQALEDRFWAKVDKNGPTPEHMPEIGPCWVWKGRIVRGGYGALRVAGHHSYAHRAAYALQYAAIPVGMLVCHRCDNPSCVRGDHLFLGTHRDNTLDMFQKGRGAVGERHGSHTHPESRPVGSANGRSRLTEDDVRAIRQLCRAGYSQRVVARQFGVVHGAVRDIMSGRRWSYISQEES